MIKHFYLTSSRVHTRRPPPGRGEHRRCAGRPGEGCWGRPGQADTSLPFRGSRLQRLKDPRPGGWAPRRRGQLSPGRGFRQGLRMRTASRGKAEERSGTRVSPPAAGPPHFPPVWPLLTGAPPSLGGPRPSPAGTGSHYPPDSPSPAGRPALPCRVEVRPNPGTRLESRGALRGPPHPQWQRQPLTSSPPGTGAPASAGLPARPRGESKTDFQTFL